MAIKTFNAKGAAIPEGRFVATDNTADDAAQATARADDVVGITVDGAAQNAPIAVALGGEIARAEVGAAGIAITDEWLTVDEATGNGRVVPASSAQVAYARNIKNQAASAGEFVDVLVLAQPYTLP